MSYNGHHNRGVDLDASYDFDSEIDLAWESDTDINLDVNIDYSLDFCVDIDGNVASGSIDAQAFGDDTFTDFQLLVLTNDDYSSSTGWAISVTG